MAAARLSAAFVYQSTDPRYPRVTGTGSGLALGELPSSECSVGRQPSQFQRSAFTSHLSFSAAGRHCQVEVNRPSQFQRPAFVRVTSHLSSSFSGRHSPATSASEVGIHQPSPSQVRVGIAAVSVSEVRSGQVYSASDESPAIQGSDRHRQPLADVTVSVSERPRSSSYLPSAGAGARQRARLRLRCPEARRHQPTIIDQSSMRA